MNIRKATSQDINQLKELYYNTITSINRRDYNEEQIHAWASTADRTEGLLRRIDQQYFFVAENDEHIITGFASLDKTGYLDMMYVHKDFQNQGIAAMLFEKIKETALALNISKLETEASITAKPFFEKHGFHVVLCQTIEIKGVELTNYKMEKILNS